ncbi:helix-turn-helix domain-containing protein [Parapedobacter deserti]|uniref:Helix-turn-helix domain-containing protein n=1 Tax=Parapedobacter deserti TaxID=1912957 RepID=A0ABV7JG62_9SPHI
MLEKHIKITKLDQHETSNLKGHYYSFIWTTSTAAALLIDGMPHQHVANSMFFLGPAFQWKVAKTAGSVSAGYAMFLTETFLADPLLSRMKVNDLCVLQPHSVNCSPVNPAIEARLLTILELIDELLTTQLIHKEEALRGLVCTLFSYCDQLCKFMSAIGNPRAKDALIYKYKKLLASKINELHDVNDYAYLLNISSKYLNECTQDVLQMTAKSLIIEQLTIHARRQLKFSDKTVKEISFHLGFSSPDYFSTFCKKHIGCSPTTYRSASAEKNEGLSDIITA